MMKKIIFMMLLSTSMFAQKVYNVQQYCIDEAPLNKNECDIAGNEYSFVFVDQKKNEVAFFLTDMKLKYQIVSSAAEAGAMRYKLKSEQDMVEMTINKTQTKIEFLYPKRKISLIVGKSTKQQ